MAGSLQVKIAHSVKVDARKAVTELVKQLSSTACDLIVFFCSVQYDLTVLAEELDNNFTCRLIGCTTAGEISSENGFQKKGIVAAAICSTKLQVHPYLIENISRFDINTATTLSNTIRTDLKLSSLAGQSMFGFLLIDGLSFAEEKTAALLYSTLDNMPLFGGSAGDDLAFKNTFVYFEGEFRQNCALLTIFDTSLPFYIFRTHHLIPTDKKLVITGTMPGKRCITEINGYPAALEYGQIINKKLNELTPVVFSKHPLLLKVGGESYIRTISSVNADGSLSLYCDIDRGLVVSIAKPDNLVENIKMTLSEVLNSVSNPCFILGCDCIARRLELEDEDLMSCNKNIFSNCTLLGFSTYGEQYNAIHVNQTFTGVVIGDV